ncbi:hypothetical protein [Ureibacillus sp. FSL W8-0352]|uniref:hypothetical protein n=1 Tax=Ureibacillus sp. FSL W8-0352 TaxID=2954596 RepID=UPI0030F86966
MEVAVKYLFNRTRNSRIESDIEIMYFEEYDYEDFETDLEKEREFVNEVTNLIKQKYGYFSVKVTSFSEI